MSSPIIDTPIVIATRTGRSVSTGSVATSPPPTWRAPVAVPVRRPQGLDVILLAAVLSLVAFGVLMVYSASAIYASRKFGSPNYFLFRELVYVGTGLVALWTATRVDYSTYRRWVYPLLILSIGMLVGVLLVGARINGARRWFHFAGLSFQPAELAKVSLVIYLAYSLAKKADKVRLFKIGFLPHIAICGVMMLLLLKQPDLGTAVIMGLATLLVMGIAGAKISYLFIALLSAAPVVYQAIVGTTWRMRRMLAYIDPWQYRRDVGYQVTESLISIGSGGVFGTGLGGSRQKLFFLPEAHTDYIMAIVGEELGLVGIVAVLVVFAILIWRGAQAALRARDAFGCYLAFGITAMFGLQAMVNIGVVLGALPTKGLPLPFVSYGGSTLIVDLFAVGILLNVSARQPAPQSDWSDEGAITRLRRHFANRRRRGKRVVIVNARATAPAEVEADEPEEGSELDAPPGHRGVDATTLDPQP